MKHPIFATALLAAFGTLAFTGALAQTPTTFQAARPVKVSVNAAQVEGELKPVWRFFGADEPNYATMKDGRKLLLELGKLKHNEVYFRAHNLMSSGDGTPAFKWGSTNMYTEDKDGNPVYNWTIIDRIIDTYRERGVYPYLQIGFMPEALSSAPAGMPYQPSWRPGFPYSLIFTGWAYPPKSYEKWEELVYQWTLHNVQRYGRAEVEKWYFEVWNEPEGYWRGTQEEFHKLHDYAIAGVKRALPSARVGGPDVGGPNVAVLESFMNHVATGRNYATGEIGTPTDFLAFHAKGSPQFVDNHVRMGIATHLKNVDRGFTTIAGFQALAKKPIVIGESDPEGCAACPGPQNSYRNGTMYSSYTAAVFPRIWELAEKRKVNLEGVLTWAFEFEDQPWFAGYRQLSTNGVDLPVLNVFRLFSKLGSQKIKATSDGQAPLEDIMTNGVRGSSTDVGVLATRDASGQVAILLWNYHDDDVPGSISEVQLSVAGLKGDIRQPARLWRVDEAHANAYSAWKRMGSPQSPNDKQYAELEKASVMTPSTLASEAGGKRGEVSFNMTIPVQGVALLVFDGR